MRRPRPTAIFLAAACLAPACGEPGTGMGDAIPVIDAHIHTDFTGEPEPASGIPETLDRLMTEWQRAGVVAAVAHTDTSGAGWVDLRDRNVIHCGGVGGRVDLERLELGLAEGRYRCLKIYLGYAYRHATDSAYEPVYALAREHDVPVVFHAGDTYSSSGKLKYAHPLAIDEVAVDHRDVDFLIAHAGYPWYRTAAEIAYKNPNVYIEASAFMLGDPADRPADWLERFVIDPIAWIFGYIEDPAKVLFGSDWPLVDVAGYVDAYKRAVPREHWRAVFHDNAARLFRLDSLHADGRTRDR